MTSASSPEIGPRLTLRNFFDNPEKKKPAETIEQMHDRLAIEFSRMPPGPERDAKLRGLTLAEYRRKAMEARAIINTDEHRKFVGENMGAVTEALGASGLSPDYLRQRTEGLESIREIALSGDPAQPFDLMNFVAAINRELLEIREMENAIPETANPAARGALARERAYLETMLGWFRISPPSIDVLKKFDLLGNPIKQKDVQTRSLLRTAWVVIGGGMTLLSAIMAFCMNRKSPDFTSTAIWAAFTGIGFIDWGKLGKEGVRVRDQISCLSYPAFTGFVDKHHGPNAAEAVRALFSQDPGDMKTLILTMRDGKDAAPAEARAQLARIMTARPELKAEVDAMLADPGFANFILAPLTNVKDDDLKRWVVNAVATMKVPSA